MLSKFNKFPYTSLIGALVLLLYAIVAILTTVKLQNASIEKEESEIRENLEVHQEYIQSLIRGAYLQAVDLRNLALEFKSQNAQSRYLTNQILKSGVESNHDFLGLWMVWEPNEFDGSDEDFVNTPGSNDEGRFVPYWHWEGDSVILENCILYDGSDYYQLPKRTHQDYLIEPYLYPVGSQDIMLISISLPIIDASGFVGVAGVDISNNSIQSLVSRIAKIENAEGFLISGNGTYVVHSDPKLIGSHTDMVTIFDGYESVSADDNIWEDTENENLLFMSKINFDFVDKPWTLILKVPKDNINAAFISVRSNLLLMSGISALIIFFLISYNSAQRKLNDVKQRKIQDELTQADARLTSHIEGPNPASIYSVDRDFQYTGFNTTHKREMKEVFGADVKVGKYMPSLLPKDLEERLLLSFKRVMNGERFNLTTIFDDKYFTQTFNPVFDQDSQIIGLTSSIQEVTDMVKAEMELDKYRDQLENLVEERTKELTYQKEFFQNVIDQIPALIFVRDAHQKYVLVNQLAADGFDMKISDVIGKNIDLMHPDKKEVQDFTKEDLEILKTGIPFFSDYKMTWPDGSERWLYLTKRKISINQEPHILGIHVDVTHLKKTQLQLTMANHELLATLESLKSTQMMLIESEKMASIGLLTAGLAHEINNPINYVAGNVNVIKRDLAELKILIEKIIVNSGNHEHAEIQIHLTEIYQEMDNLIDGIDEGTNRVVSLIRDLSTFSANNNTKDTGPVHVNECIESTLNLVKYQSGKKIEFFTDLGVVPLIKGSSQKLKQVCLNILTNACQAIRIEGKIRVKSYFDSDNIHIRISDNGEGILEENVNRIFEPFFTTKEVGEGTGLGLTISYNIIKDFGGHIKLVDKQVDGTTFEIVLPMAIA